MSKVRMGISFEPEVVKCVDEQIGLSPELAIDRSETVNILVKSFFRSDLDHRIKLRELVILNRNGHPHLTGVHDVHTEGEAPAIVARS